MSHKSKSVVASMVVGAVILVAYVVYVLQANDRGTEDASALQWWAQTMLVFLAIAVGALIVVQIVFRIVLGIGIAVQERGDSDRVERILETSLAEDEMDRLIGLRSARVGYVCFGAGFLGMLIVLALGGSPVVALNIVFWSFAVGSLAGGAVSVHGYERGVRHG